MSSGESVVGSWNRISSAFANSRVSSVGRSGASTASTVSDVMIDENFGIVSSRSAPVDEMTQSSSDNPIDVEIDAAGNTYSAPDVFTRPPVNRPLFRPVEGTPAYNAEANTPSSDVSRAPPLGLPF